MNKIVALAGVALGAVAGYKAFAWAWDQSPSIRLDQRYANLINGKGFVRDDEAKAKESAK